MSQTAGLWLFNVLVNLIICQKGFISLAFVGRLRTQNLVIPVLRIVIQIYFKFSAIDDLNKS